MPSSPESATAEPLRLGELLKHWRARRACSQLALALDTGLSQRHLSFIESGRSQPSRAVLLRLAQSLDMPLRDRNALLLAAGHAPEFVEGAWNADEMQVVTRALQRLLRQHEPFPALVLNHRWDVLHVSEAAPRFFGRFTDLARRARPRNLLGLLLDPQGLRPAIDAWPDVAAALLGRLKREATGGVMDPSVVPLARELEALAGAGEEVDPPQARLPVVPVGFKDGSAVRRYFSLVSTVGTPRTVAAQELRVECMVPADDDTERWHLATFGRPGAA